MKTTKHALDLSEPELNLNDIRLGEKFYRALLGSPSCVRTGLCDGCGRCDEADVDIAEYAAEKEHGMSDGV